MRNWGLRNPSRSAVIFGLIAAAGSVSVLCGVREMLAAGEETRLSAPLIGGGLFAAILGAALFVNYLRAGRIVAAMRSGRTAIARWTVPPDQFARFRESDLRLAEQGHNNDYRAPRSVGPNGVEVVFADDGVLIGDTFFPLATTGMARILGARVISGDPPMIEFHTVLSRLSNARTITVTKTMGKLRVPIATDSAVAGSRITQFYQDIVDRRTIVNPQFWTRRINFGLIVTPLAAILAGIGFLLRDRNQELANVPLVLAVAGTIVALAGLVMAALAWGQRGRQYRR